MLRKAFINAVDFKIGFGNNVQKFFSRIDSLVLMALLWRFRHFGFLVDDYDFCTWLQTRLKIAKDLNRLEYVVKCVNEEDHFKNALGKARVVLGSQKRFDVYERFFYRLSIEGLKRLLKDIVGEDHPGRPDTARKLECKIAFARTDFTNDLARFDAHNIKGAIELIKPVSKIYGANRALRWVLGQG